MSKSDRNWDQVKWTPFTEVFIEQRAGARNESTRTFVNSIYQVEVEARKMPAPLNVVVWLSFKTLDRQPRHNWREMQQIKNELVGEHVEAVEIYPDEDRLVDTCNQYHLWCFPALSFEGRTDRWFPFGYSERLVSEGSAPGGGERQPGKARQTDFRPELRPEDALSATEIAKLTYRDEVKGRCPICGAGFKRLNMLDGTAMGYACLKNNHFVAAEAT